MKTPFALFAGLLLAVSAPLSLARETGAQFIREMAVDADVQERFFARFPDLADERDVVAESAQHLPGSELAPLNSEEAAEALAGRARTVLSLRTPQEWQNKAVSLFPELGVAGSEFNQLFLERYRELEKTSPQFQQEPSWPVLLAKRCADELSARTAPISAANATTAARPVPSPATPAEPIKGFSFKGFALATFSVLVLAALLWLPARWMFRVSHTFGRREETATLWQRALSVGAWTYLGVALLALVNTFRANLDQHFVDRFGITLLVSLLAGLVAVIPALAIAYAIFWWLRRSHAQARTMGRVPADSNTPAAR